MQNRPDRRWLGGVGLAASVAMALWAAACGPIGPLLGRASETWTHSYQLSKNGQVSISNVNGRVVVEGVDGSTVDVSAEKIARAGTDQLAGELLKRIAISDQSTPDSVSLKTEKMEGILIGAGFEVRYRVKVPKTATVQASTVNGGVEVSDMGGRLVARTTNGGIVARRLTGGVEARVVNGGVRIQMASVGKDEVSLSTVNGGVRLGLPDSAKATVSANWVNGGMRRSGLSFAIRDDSRRHFEGLLNGGGTAVTLSTVNGGIAIAASGDDFSKDDSDESKPERLKELSQ
jgi:Putative adhesin